MTNVNLIIGRFQPFTKGHYKCIEEAMKVKGVPTVIAMIDTPEEKVDEKHPFPSSMLLPLYKNLFEHDSNVLDIILVKNADIVKIGEAFAEKGYKICSWTCGTDRIQAYSRMSSKYKEQAGLADDFEMIEIHRTDEDISATKVRQALLDDDKKTFINLTPKVSLSSYMKQDIYNTLREQIVKVMK